MYIHTQQCDVLQLAKHKHASYVACCGSTIVGQVVQVTLYKSSFAFIFSLSLSVIHFLSLSRSLSLSLTLSLTLSLSLCTYNIWGELYKNVFVFVRFSNIHSLNHFTHRSHIYVCLTFSPYRNINIYIYTYIIFS